MIRIIFLKLLGVVTLLRAAQLAVFSTSLIFNGLLLGAYKLLFIVGTIMVMWGIVGWIFALVEDPANNYALLFVIQVVVFIFDIIFGKGSNIVWGVFLQTFLFTVLSYTIVYVDSRHITTHYYEEEEGSADAN